MRQTSNTAHIAAIGTHALFPRLLPTFSTRKALIPLGPGPPVRAITRYTSDAPPPAVKPQLDKDHGSE